MEIVKNYKKLVFTEKALLELENEMYILPYSIGVEIVQMFSLKHDDIWGSIFKNGPNHNFEKNQFKGKFKSVSSFLLNNPSNNNYVNNVLHCFKWEMVKISKSIQTV